MTLNVLTESHQVSLNNNLLFEMPLDPGNPKMED